MPDKKTFAKAREIAREISADARKRLSDFAESEARRISDVAGHCAVLTGSGYPASLPQETRAPQWWYSCFQQGHHDITIYEIEWAYEAYLRLRPNAEVRHGGANDGKL